MSCGVRSIFLEIPCLFILSSLTGDNNPLFNTIAKTLGHPEWTSDERFRTNSSRVAYIDDLVAIMTKELCRKTTSHWVKVLGEAGPYTYIINTCC